MDRLKIAGMYGETRKTIQGKNHIVRIMPADSSIRPHGVGRDHSFQSYMCLSEEITERDAYGKTKTFRKCTTVFQAQLGSIAVVNFWCYRPFLVDSFTADCY